VTVEGSPEAIYEASADRNVVARAKELGGLLLMVTHTLDPAGLYTAPRPAAICGLAYQRKSAVQR
jgi:hypothetical protein